MTVFFCLANGLGATTSLPSAAVHARTRKKPSSPATTFSDGTVPADSQGQPVRDQAEQRAHRPPPRRQLLPPWRHRVCLRRSAAVQEAAGDLRRRGHVSLVGSQRIRWVRCMAG